MFYGWESNRWPDVSPAMRPRHGLNCQKTENAHSRKEIGTLYPRARGIMRKNFANYAQRF